MDAFKLGKPALVCRWRLSNGELPLQNRHMRALAARRMRGEQVSTSLVGWVKQRVEWGLDANCEHPDGVLMLVVDENGASALSLGAYQPLANCSARELLTRAQGSRMEAESTGVAPEELWLAQGNALVRCTSSEYSASGASSLIADLAHTMGLNVRRDAGLLDELEWHGYAQSEVFLVSDEHGVVPASDHGGQRADKFAQSYAKLLARSLRRRV